MQSPWLTVVISIGYCFVFTLARGEMAILILCKELPFFADADAGLCNKTPASRSDSR